MSAQEIQIGGQHYKQLGIQPERFAMLNGWDFDAGSILKYVTRHRQKNGSQDIEKALHFVDLRLESLEVMRERSFSTKCGVNAIRMHDYCVENSLTNRERYALLMLDAWVKLGENNLAFHLRFALQCILQEYDSDASGTPL